MKKQNLTRGAVFALIAAVVSNSAVADSKKAHDFYFQQSQKRFFGQPQNARTFGMAGSSVATSSDSSSTVGNPAGLGMMQKGDFSVSYSNNEISGREFPSGDRIREKEGMGSVLMAVPLGPVKDDLPDFGNLGFGWSGRTGDWGSSDDLNTDSDAYQLTLAYGAAIDKDTSIGYSLTYNNDKLRSDIYNYKMTNGFNHTVGLQNQVSEDLSLGAQVNVGHGSHGLRSTAGNESVDQLSVGTAFGAALKLAPETTLTGSADYTYYRNNGDGVVADPRIVFGGDSFGHVGSVRVGIEHMLADWVALRGGYRYAANFNWEYDRPELDGLDGSAKFNAWSAGLGLKHDLGQDSFIQAVHLDYGVEYRALGNDDWQHVITLSAPFDLCQ
jgi:hypothetical protein